MESTTVRIIEKLTHYRYFDTDTHSDVTVRSGPESIKAHKIVLCQASPYFASCFEKGFKVSAERPTIALHTVDQEISQEKSQPILDLKEDDPKAIRGLIAWACGLHFDGISSYNWFRYKPTACVEGVKFVKYQIDLWVAANKYMFWTLASEISMGLAALLKGIVSSRSYPQGLLDVAQYVYVAHAVEAFHLRSTIVEALRPNMVALKRGSNFKNLLLEIPELACDLLWAAPEGSSQPQSSNKRQRSDDDEHMGDFLDEHGNLIQY